MEYAETNAEGRRNVFFVVHHVLNHIIPDEEEELKKALTKFKNNLFNQAPEVLYGSYLWTRFIGILNVHIVSLDQTWQKELQNYLANNKQSS